MKIRLPKITKDKVCTIVQISYHLLFLGGTTTIGNYYIDEFEKTRKVIVEQVDKARETVDKVRKTGDNINSSIESIDKELKKVRKACSRISI